MVIPWTAKRQIIFLSIFILLVVIILGSLWYYINRPDCFDNKQNQGEEGVDCGGPCDPCIENIKDLIVIWSKPFELREGFYDAAALIDNPNLSLGITDIKYRFKLYDKDNILIGLRERRTFINPGEKYVIFESNIETDKRKAARAFIEFDVDPRQWREIKKDKHQLTISRKQFDLSPFPKLVAVVENPTLSAYKDVFAVVLLLDSEKNAKAVSSTKIDLINPESSREIVFTWPSQYDFKAIERCVDQKVSTTTQIVLPADIMLVFDRSGSMNDDSLNPPEPLTSAKNAARIFIDELKSSDQIGLVSFATTASFPIDQQLSVDHRAVKNSIDKISIETPDSTQHTNLGDAILRASEEILSSRHQPRAESAIIALTDGIISRPLDPEGKDPLYPEQFAIDLAQQARDSGIAIYIIGLGDKVNEDFLKNDIASSAEHYFKAAQASELEDIYRQIAKIVYEERIITNVICFEGDILYSDIFFRTNLTK